ncbi:flavin reductase [Conexibacter sp. CPCC 206217]|uniref:flavin reductase n=1 Tax=Conexibacter sp. CPCC 206217 TaxID=3064574 RepID=UPI002728F39E|nr:flavin reductase [Conexibacter sp. CPCC 206217]MDO8210233.1 flavin reductase [Conexibacter sp. CPCC 206217]
MGEPDDAAIATATTAAATLTPDQFRDVIGRFASGVTVITATAADGTPFGATASAVSSLSLEPPMLLVCLRQGSSTGSAIAASGRFAVNVLSEDQAELAVRFAGRAGDRFAGVGCDLGDHGIPLLHDALATLECHVTETVTGGTHAVFLARVERASGSSGAPLAYYRGQFGRLELAQDEAASREVRARVLRRELPVQQPVDVDALAAALSVTRGAAYQALVKLTGEGLVERDADGCFVVRPVTLATVMDSVRTRYALLVGAVTLARERPGAPQLASLRELARASAPPAGPSDAGAWNDARAAFGDALIAEVAGPAALDAFRRADVPGLIVRLWSGSAAASAPRRAQLRDGVERLVDALERDDLPALAATARQLVDVYEQLYGAAFADRLEI